MMKEKIKIIISCMMLILMILTFIINNGIENTKELYDKIINEKEIIPKDVIILSNQQEIPKGIHIINETIDKKIYSKGEKVKIEFNVTNTLKENYNISVNFIFQGTQKYTWKNESLENCGKNISLCGYYFYYYPSEKGKWSAYLTVETEINKTKFFDESIIDFEIIY